MADLKKLAMGRKAFAKPAPPAKVKGKPAKKLEDGCKEEVGEVEAAFRDRMAKEDKRKRLATDSEFWFAVYFPSREAKHEFLKRHGLDKIGNKYLSGEAVARVFDSGRGGPRDGHSRGRR